MWARVKRSALSLGFAGLAIVALAPLARAAMGGVGFHSTAAPIGVRHWFTDRVAGDLGLNYSFDKTKTTATNQQGQEVSGFSKNTHYTVDVGIPIRLARYEKIHLLARPGFSFGGTKSEPLGGRTITTRAYSVAGELEIEYWLTEKLSISASQGAAYQWSQDNDTPERKSASFDTLGANFTFLGFHVYLW